MCITTKKKKSYTYLPRDKGIYFVHSGSCVYCGKKKKNKKQKNKKKGTMQLQTQMKVSKKNKKPENKIKSPQCNHYDAVAIDALP